MKPLPKIHPLKFMKKVMDKAAPFAEQDERGFHIESPYMDEEKAHVFRKQCFVIALVVLTGLAGLVYYHFCK